MSNVVSEEKIKKGCGVGCLVFFLMLVLLIVVMVSCQGDKEDKPFSFTIDEFEKNFEQIINKNKGNSFIELNSKQLVDGSYHIKLMDGITIIVAVDENNAVTSIGTVTISEYLLVYNRELKIAYQSLIESVDPSLGVVQQLHILDKLGMSWDSKMLDHSADVIFNDYTYLYRGNIEDNMLIFKIIKN